MKAELEEYFDRLWPICRSITGDGLRQSYGILEELIPLNLHEIPSGKQVFDWTIPKEWNITEAYIITPDGKKIAEFAKNNLHLVNYSIPFSGKMSFEELKPHLHTIPEMPDAIPYVTTYYRENWGFCITYDEFDQLPKEGLYEVVINSELKDGSLTYGELVLPGNTDREILFSSYLCHPSMANNELSGPLALAFVYRELAKLKNRKYSYRFVIAPETIGVISFLHEFGDRLKENLDAGYVLTCCGDSGKFNYKRSKYSSAKGDKMAEHILKRSGAALNVREFSVGGSDERQYCSPGFNLPVGSIMRTPYQEYNQYHTSLDNKDFISFEALSETVQQTLSICKGFELDEYPVSTVQNCEPHLGKRGLYPSSVNPKVDRNLIHRRMHLLTYADGNHSLLDIAEKRNESIMLYENEVNQLRSGGLLASDE